jgi:hypothetical protein
MMWTIQKPNLTRCTNEHIPLGQGLFESRKITRNLSYL